MKPVRMGLLAGLVATFAAQDARASFLVDPAGGTLLWGDDATYDDVVIRNRQLGFDFTFFDNDPVPAIDVSTNGNLNFSGDSDYSNERLLNPILRLSPLWDDLEVTAGTGDYITEKTGQGRLYAVTWKMHEHGSGTQHSFQVVIFGAAQRINGLDFAAGDIVFSYAAIGPTFAKDVATVGLDDGDAGLIVPLPGANSDTGLLPHGEAGLLPTGAGAFVLFHPDEFGGYTASTHINRTPDAADDTRYTTGRGRVALNVLANDVDPDGNPLTIASVTQGAFGNVTIAPDQTLSYTPGSAFAGADIFTYAARDPYGLTSTARVTLLPFAAGKGSFDGLISDAPDEPDAEPTVTSEGAGYLKIMLTGAGGFSGMLNYGGFTRIVRGAFDAHGGFTASFQREVDGDIQTVTLALHLDLTNELQPLTGTITDGNAISNIAGGRTRYAAATFPAPQAGRYTVLLQPDESSFGAAGIGYALMSVKPGGAVSLAGKLGSGKTFSFGSHVISDGTFPFFFSIPAGKGLPAGSIFGTVKFDESDLLGDCSADLRWFDPDPEDGSLTESAPRLLGCRYISPPRGVRILQIADTRHNATMDLGGLYQETLTITAANKAIVEAGGDEALTLTINPAAGTFLAGFLEDPSETQRRRAVNGVFLRKANIGGGLYLGVDGAAAPVMITPPEP